MSSAEMPFSGISRRTGPSQAFSFSPIQRPIAAFSSGVVRIRVTFGLWW